jgi:ATP-dependent Zn protease
VDSLGKARGGLNSSDEREQTLNQILTEMDGFADGSAEGSSSAPGCDRGTGDGAAEGSSSSSAVRRGAVVVVAATNRPQVAR